MITLENDQLHFRFPDVHEQAHCYDLVPADAAHSG